MTSLTAQAVRFAGVGVTATLVHVAAALIAASMTGLAPLWANAIGFLGAVSVSYAGNFYWTFGSGDHAATMPRFAALSVVAFATSHLTVLIASDFLGWPIAVSMLLVVMTVPPISFIVLRGWVFWPSAGRSDLDQAL